MSSDKYLCTSVLFFVVGIQVVLGRFDLSCFRSNSNQASLTTIGGIKAHLQDYSDDVGLFSEFGAPLKKLNELVSQGNNNVCSDEKISAIEDFANTYMHFDADSKLPQFMRDSFVAYGQLISAACKQNIVPLLQMANKHDVLTNDDDYQLMSKWSGADSLLAGFMGKLKDKDHLNLPVNLMKRANDNGHKLVFQAPSSSSMARWQLVCANRLKPVYEKAIEPVVRLANLGLDFSGPTPDKTNPDLAMLVSTWYRVAFVCESFLNIELVNDPDYKFDQLGDEQKKAIRFLSNDEAEQLRQRAEKDGFQLSPLNEEIRAQIEPFKFDEENIVSLADEAKVNVDVKSFTKAIRKYRSNKQKMVHNKFKLTKNIGRFILQNLKSDKFKLVGEGHTNASGLIKTLDVYVNGPLESETLKRWARFFEITAICLAVYLLILALATL